MKDLIVTLADENYLDQAKQLFSSIYFNAGWQGDYMLLAHEVSEDKLKWFRGKGILIKKCYLDSDKINPFWPAVILNKFYLFTPEFKKWKNIVYLDADTIVWACLDRLAAIKGLAAVSGYGSFKKYFFNISYLLADKKKIKQLKELKKTYDFNEVMFNSGMLAFSSDFIEEDTFQRLISLSKEYKEILSIRDEPAFNFLFYKKWQELSRAYNAFPKYSLLNSDLDARVFQGIVSHFVLKKPWNCHQTSPRWQHYFYRQWQANLDRADLIALEKRLPPKKRWTNDEIQNFSDFLMKSNDRFSFKTIYHKTAYFLDRLIGLLGLFLKHNFPGIYYALKKIKK